MRGAPVPATLAPGGGPARLRRLPCRWCSRPPCRRPDQRNRSKTAPHSRSTQGRKEVFSCLSFGDRPIFTLLFPARRAAKGQPVPSSQSKLPRYRAIPGISHRKCFRSPHADDPWTDCRPRKTSSCPNREGEVAPRRLPRPSGGAGEIASRRPRSSRCDRDRTLSRASELYRSAPAPEPFRPRRTWRS